ncbi:MAG: SDR family oxidoreductase [Deltaproteobacteria bacterium]|nr:SDR family oxidoreductase [Deltaproteobacteria bacterium]
MKVIRGKKAVVTGAASGIGRAIAMALAHEGADLYLIDIDAAKLAAVTREAESCGVAVASTVCDLSEPAQVSATVKSLLSAWSSLNILVNNAGVAYYGPTHEMSAEQWQRVLAVNLMAPVQLVRELIPALAAAEQAHILNVCSIFGLVTMRKGAAYQTSKSGLVGFTAALRAEYGRPGFGVTALCPGFVRTPMIETFATGRPEQARHKLPAWACTSAEKVAESAIRAIRRDRGLVVVSLPARLLWWLMRLSPALFDWLTREGWRRKGKIDIARS